MRRKRLHAAFATLVLLGGLLLVLASWGNISGLSTIVGALGGEDAAAATQAPEDGPGEVSQAFFPVDPSEVLGSDADERIVCMEISADSAENAWAQVDARLVAAGWEEVVPAGTEVSRNYRRRSDGVVAPDDACFLFVIVQSTGRDTAVVLMRLY